MWSKVRHLSSYLLIILLAVIVGAGAARVFTGKSIMTGNMVAQAREFKEWEKIVPFTPESLWLMKQAKAIIEAYQVDADSNDISEKDLLYGAMDGMVSAWGDPYTRFVSPERLDQEKIDLAGKYGGLGIYIGQRDGMLLVISPIEDTPADKAGLKPQDQIVKVNDEIVLGWDINEIVKILRGKPGTDVTIWVRREGETELLKFDMTREEIKLKSVRFELLSDDIGYVRLSQFKETSAEDLRKALEELKKKNAKGFILDLRNNGGGLLNAAVDISDMFLEKGLVVGTRGRVKRADSELFSTEDIVTDLPLVVLINEGSASASEIVAGALHDRYRALLIGKKSFGKGSVQTLFNLSDGSAMYVTIARYYTPKGTIIDHIGISPDIEVDGEWTRVRSEDKQLKEAENTLLHIISGDIEIAPVVSEDLPALAG